MKYREFYDRIILESSEKDMHQSFCKSIDTTIKAMNLSIRVSHKYYKTINNDCSYKVPISIDNSLHEIEQCVEMLNDVVSTPSKWGSVSVPKGKVSKSVKEISGREVKRYCKKIIGYEKSVLSAVKKFLSVYKSNYDPDLQRDANRVLSMSKEINHMILSNLKCIVKNRLKDLD